MSSLMDVDLRETDDGLDWSAAKSLTFAVVTLIDVVVTIIWLAAGGGAFWPVWVWIGLGLPAAYYLSIRSAARAPERWRPLSIHGAVFGVTTALMISLWLLTTRGYFWPIWVIIGTGLPVALHALGTTMWHRVHPERERELVQRVDVLTRTRRGALDVQNAQLRQIERDLHDGAQARLVALSMQLGRAEGHLEDQPEVAALVRGARAEASAAIAELRDLARGIAPPVLADRGLAAAVESLGKRSPMPVTVTVSVPTRLPPVVESAAYFVVAEALTNVAKHAGGAAARVVLEQRDGRLEIEVADDGPGGADRRGGGLTGLRHRVEALDGTLIVVSVPGAGTTIRAELPCES
jgi:signal transduction histidine kinase